MTGPIHQEVVFKTSPQRLYAALTDAKQFSAITGGALCPRLLEGWSWDLMLRWPDPPPGRPRLCGLRSALEAMWDQTERGHLRVRDRFRGP